MIEKIAFDIIYDIMILQYIAFGGHFNMDAAKLPPWTVVVNHQIMGAQHVGIAHDLLLNILNQLGIRGAAEQRVKRLADQSESAVQNEDGYSKSHPSVEFDAGEMRNQGCCKHCDRSDDVVSVNQSSFRFCD